MKQKNILFIVDLPGVILAPAKDQKGKISTTIKCAADHRRQPDTGSVTWQTFNIFCSSTNGGGLAKKPLHFIHPVA